MAREDERILERFIERGLPSQGSRALQRATAPSLSGEIATSLAQRRNVQAQRASQANIASSISARQAISGARGRSGVGAATGAPLGVVQRGPGVGFELNVPSGSGATSSKRQFQNIDELVAFLQSPEGEPLKGRLVTGGLGLDGQDSVGGSTQGISADDLSKLRGLVQLTNRSQARQVVGREAGPQGFNVLNKFNRSGVRKVGKDDLTDEAIELLGL